MRSISQSTNLAFAKYRTFTLCKVQANSSKKHREKNIAFVCGFSNHIQTATQTFVVVNGHQARTKELQITKGNKREKKKGKTSMMQRAL
jgi:hypothetical protein